MEFLIGLSVVFLILSVVTAFLIVSLIKIDIREMELTEAEKELGERLLQKAFESKFPNQHIYWQNDPELEIRDDLHRDNWKEN